MDRLIRCFALLMTAGSPVLAQAANTKVDAAALVRRINAEEFTIHDFDSFSVRMETTETRASDQIEKSRKELVKQLPNLEISEKRFSHLRPKVTGATEFSYDRQRLRYYCLEHDTSLDLRVWDKEKGSYHDKYFTHQQEQFGYMYRDEYSSSFQYLFFRGLPWLGVARHNFWWTPTQRHTLYRAFPDEFEIVKEEVCQDRPCYVVANVWSDPANASQIFLWIGKEDGKLYGRFYRLDLEPLRKKMKQLSEGRYGTLAFQSWYDSLDSLQQEAFNKSVFDSTSQVASVRPEIYFDDYREISPGFSIPHTIRSVSYSNKAATVPSYERLIRIVDVQVNPKFSDEFFRIKFEKGVQVADQRMSPALIYTHKDNMNKEELAAILAAHYERIDESSDRNNEYKRSIGQMATEFKKASIWFNHAPLTFEKDLKGKVVLLDFWDIDCGPCYNDLARLSDVHKNIGDSGIEFIGILCSMENKDEIQKVLDAQNIKYPICMDFYAPWEKMPLRGYLAKSYLVSFVPFAVVIDADGRVAEAGPLREVLPKAYELARKLKVQTTNDRPATATGK